MSINIITPAQKIADETTIRAARTDSNACIAKHDVAGVAKYWMQDIVVISGEGTTYTGKKHLMNIWKKMFADSPVIFERLPSDIVIGDSGILAWETGQWHCTNASYRGNYSAMWRKINGNWITQSELYVSLD